MVLDELKSKIDRLWDAFWSNGISNSIEVADQVTYLLFLRRLDVIQASEEEQHERTGTPAGNFIYTTETDHLRWDRLKKLPPDRMYSVVRDEVFPWLRSITGSDINYTHHLRDARFTIPTPSLLAKVIDLLDELPLVEGHAGGDLYEYMLSKNTISGQSGQLRTPRHIIQLMVELMAPSPEDEVCDPVCGTAGFLVAAAEYISRVDSEALRGSAEAEHFNHSMFHGFDFDNTMLRLASMNMLLRGIEQPDIRHRDSLAQNVADETERYSLILANPPFAGSLDYETTANDLLQVVKTRKAELLFLALFLRLLKPGGRAAVIVPDGVLFGSSTAHKELRRVLLEDHKLDGVIKLPSGVFKPYSGISTSILLFTKTNSGGTDNVWFYEVTADGFSLDSRHAPLLGENKTGPRPTAALEDGESARNNLPDLITRWAHRNDSERKRRRSEQSFCVAKKEIIAQDYNLSINCYREIGEGTRSGRVEDWRLGDFTEIHTGWIPAQEIQWDAHPDKILNEQRVLHASMLTSPLPSIEDLPIHITDRRTNRLREGDIVGRAMGSNRNWTILPSEYEGIQAGQGVLIIRIIRNIAPAEYIVSYLSTPQAERAISRRGTEIPHVSTNDLANLAIPACEGDFESIRSAVSVLNEGADEIQRIKDSLDKSRMSIFEDGTKGDRRIRLEQAADLGSLISQTLSKQTEPYHVFRQTYPYAIARAVRKFQHSQTITERHEAALQCAETLITSLGIISLALAAYKDRKDVNEINNWTDAVHASGVSLGHWVGVTRAVGNELRKSGDEVAGLGQATIAKKGGKGLSADLAALTSIRNKIRHGGGPRTKAEMETSLAKVEPLLSSALTGSAFLAKTRWVYSERLSWQPKRGNYRVSGLLLMGDHPDFEPVAFETGKPVSDNNLYMLTPQREVIPLFPFCILADCPICLATELYYPDQIVRTVARLKSIDRGHDLDSEAIFEGLAEFME
ncbi:N-6 DNA methylase [Microbispora sp. NPDC046933]|uniref:N-6 DNA methylase n=1 Tax=Microbispora sp. NPDC046933 TaxID=3155618 RepID=UPI0033E088FF